MLNTACLLFFFFMPFVADFMMKNCFKCNYSRIFNGGDPFANGKMREKFWKVKNYLNIVGREVANVTRVDIRLLA